MVIRFENLYVDEFVSLKKNVHQQLISNIDISRLT